MTDAPFTPRQFADALHAAVEERGGDFVYPTDDPGWMGLEYKRGGDAAPTCQYRTANGEPACIIGAALDRIDPELVPPYGDTDSATAVLLRVLGVSPSMGRYQLPPDLRDLVDAAAAAQRAQDRGESWAVAQAAFDAWLTLEDGVTE